MIFFLNKERKFLKWRWIKRSCWAERTTNYPFKSFGKKRSLICTEMSFEKCQLTDGYDAVYGCDCDYS